MPNWFYYDVNGKKRGPINSAQLRSLVESQVINGDTDIETEDGRKGKVKQVKGLFLTAQQNDFVSVSNNDKKREALRIIGFLGSLFLIIVLFGVFTGFLSEEQYEQDIVLQRIKLQILLEKVQFTLGIIADLVIIVGLPALVFRITPKNK